jgi:DNA polymerase-3 subunit gamma/tau
VRDLEGHARDLLVVGTLGGDVPAELSVSPERDARLADQAARVPRGGVVRLLDLIAAALDAIKAGADARTQLELALVKAASPDVDPSTRALLARVEQLEAALAGGRPQAAPATSAPSPAPAPIAEPEPEPAPPPSPAPANGGTAAPAAAATAVAVASDVAAVRAVWGAVVDDVRARNGLAAAALERGRPVEVRDGELVIAYSPDDEFFVGQVATTACRELIGEALRTVTGTTLRPAYELREPEPGEDAGPPTEDEWINRFKTAFDAEEISEEPRD